MPNIPSTPTDRENILATIRIAAKEEEGVRPGFDRCLKRMKISRFQFHKQFGGWNEALREAGLDFTPRGERVKPERLLLDWGNVARKVGRVPIRLSYEIHGKYNPDTIAKRFGSWADVPRAFRGFAAEKEEWADVVAFCNSLPKDGRRFGPRGSKRQRLMRVRSTSGTYKAMPLAGRPIYGEPIHLQGMSTAPVNETGVVFLFGMLASSLGFQAQSLRTAFPDCEARRQVGQDQWQPVTIEFEYESRNFALHGHDPKGCDLIVCWSHNWPDCPKNLEVIALKDELQRLNPFQPSPRSLSRIRVSLDSNH